MQPFKRKKADANRPKYVLLVNMALDSPESGAFFMVGPLSSPVFLGDWGFLTQQSGFAERDDSLKTVENAIWSTKFHFQRDWKPIARTQFHFQRDWKPIARTQFHFQRDWKPIAWTQFHFQRGWKSIAWTQFHFPRDWKPIARTQWHFPRFGKPNSFIKSQNRTQRKVFQTGILICRIGRKRIGIKRTGSLGECALAHGMSR